MDVTGTINAGMSKMARNMKNGVDNCKINGKIVEKQKVIKTLTKEIGNLTLVRLEGGDEMCPECGAKTSSEMKYCGICGNCLREE